jgi:light-regulated signal transduction histidine kinase (bacteriophytochrome)
MISGQIFSARLLYALPFAVITPTFPGQKSNVIEVWQPFGVMESFKLFSASHTVISEQIIKQHGGVLLVDSEESIGSTFSFTLSLIHKTNKS